MRKQSYIETVYGSMIFWIKIWINIWIKINKYIICKQNKQNQNKIKTKKKQITEKKNR